MARKNGGSGDERSGARGDIKRGRNSAISQYGSPSLVTPFRAQDVCKSHRCGSVHGAINVPLNAGYISSDKWWPRKKRSYLSSRIVSHPVRSPRAFHAQYANFFDSPVVYGLPPSLNKFQSRVPRKGPRKEGESLSAENKTRLRLFSPREILEIPFRKISLPFSNRRFLGGGNGNRSKDWKKMKRSRRGRGRNFYRPFTEDNRFHDTKARREIFSLDSFSSI